MRKKTAGVSQHKIRDGQGPILEEQPARSSGEISFPGMQIPGKDKFDFFDAFRRRNSGWVFCQCALIGDGEPGPNGGKIYEENLIWRKERE